LFDAEFFNDPPITVQSYASIWTIVYRRASRYNFLLQYYLKDEGLNLSWVGTGRVVFSLDFTVKDLNEVSSSLLRACHRMEQDGWWPKERVTGKEIGTSLAKEVLKAMVARLFK
jgi:glutamate-1-semialdehyde 2,1-aminomutase